VSQLAGIVLALGLLALIGWGLFTTWRAPFRALGLLVAGMAFHNFVLMVLLALHTPDPLIRVVQLWKEAILLLLAILAVTAGWRAWRSGQRPRLHALDGIAIAFTAVTLLYFVLPSGVLHGSANLHQRLLGLRIVILIPLLYAFGRILQPVRLKDLRWVAGVIVGAAAVVGIFGLVELWLIPTDAWLSWGINQLSSFFGFAYDGPKGLPANFFQTTAEGFLLRRMVSTYISPLGIAYAGLLVIPIAAALLLERQRENRPQRWLIWLAGILLVTGVLFSLTRLALALMVLELLFLAILFRRRWLLYATPVVALAAVFMLFEYVQVGPLLDRNLHAIANRPSHLRIASTADPSLKEHAGLLGFDIRYVLAHPLGTGLGSSVHRFGSSQGTGESAILDMFGDLGVLGGVLYLALYLGAVVVGAMAYLRVRKDALRTALPLVAFIGGLGLFLISVTSDLWGDLATTFLFWWAAGASVTLAIIPAISPAREPARRS
jgi:hypothetical protein